MSSRVVSALRNACARLRNGGNVHAGAEVAVSTRAALHANFDVEIAAYSHTYTGGASGCFTW